MGEEIGNLARNGPVLICDQLDSDAKWLLDLSIRFLTNPRTPLESPFLRDDVRLVLVDPESTAEGREPTLFVSPDGYRPDSTVSGCTKLLDTFLSHGVF